MNPFYNYTNNANANEQAGLRQDGKAKPGQTHAEYEIRQLLAICLQRITALETEVATLKGNTVPAN